MCQKACVPFHHIFPVKMAGNGIEISQQVLMNTAHMIDGKVPLNAMAQNMAKTTIAVLAVV